jgi:dTDP-4-dehydrorhamnose 3,5-epimerase
MVLRRLDPASEVPLPAGVTLRPLETHPDSRGDFTELFRNQWLETAHPQQWNLVRSSPNSLRGIHVHAKHWDYVCIISGQLMIGLHDLRGPDPHAAMLRLNADRLQILTIPPGVAHGFYSPQAAAFLVGASGYYDPLDHRRCRWDCPELALDWPCTAPELSEQDARAGGYAQLRSEIQVALAKRADV